MELSIELVLYLLILVDAIAANVAAWTGVGKNVMQASSFLTKHLPMARGWAVLYLVLVLWLGCALWRLGVVTL